MMKTVLKRYWPKMARLILLVAIAPTLTGAEKPTTEQLVDKVVRDTSRSFRSDDDKNHVKALRSDKHRAAAQAILRKRIEAATDYDLANALEAHWAIFGEQATEPLLLAAAKREPTHALLALSDIHKLESNEIRQFVVESLTSADPELRYFATQVPGNHGPETVQPLIEMLESPTLPDWEGRTHRHYLRSYVLSRIRDNGSPEFIEPLLKQMNHPPSAAQAVKTLIALKESWDADARSKILNALQALFEKPSVPGRQAAAEALASLGNPAGVGFLLNGMQAETKFSGIDRLDTLHRLLPLLDENPIPKGTPFWKVDFPELADKLRERLAKKGLPVTDTRTRPTELSTEDVAIFDVLAEGRLELTDSGAVLSKKADESLANPPYYDRKAGSRSPEFLRLAAACFQDGDRQRAAQLLDLARQWGEDDAGLIQGVFHEQVTRATDSAVTHFIAGNDSQALAELRKLRGAARETLITDSYTGKMLFDELSRRENAGTLDRKPPEIPADFDQLPVGQRVAFLIDSLDTIFVRQSGYPGGVDFSEDARVAKLIEISDPAVPGLIDCIEKDRRLTRSEERWRMGTPPSLLAVREPALLAIMSILRLQVFDAAFTADSFTDRGEDAAKKMANKLRKFWKEFGHMSLDERMMHVLQAPDAEPQQLYEAAWNLSTLGAVEVIGTTFGTGGIKAAPEGKNPAIAKFENPTVAEAILAAMDRVIAHYRHALEPQDAFEIERFSDCIGNLGDPRIAPELQRLWQSASDSGPAWSFVVAAKRCGKSALFDREAAAFADGTLEVKADGEAVASPSTRTLSPFVRSFIAFDDPVSKKALAALADPQHPFFPTAVKAIGEEEDGHTDRPWTKHPFWHRVALAALSDERPSGREFWIDKSGYIRNNPSSGDGMRDWLKALNPEVGVKVPERLQDLAAIALVKRIPGLPRYHMLCPDRSERLRRIQFLTEAWAEKMYAPDHEWQNAVGFAFYGHYLFPELPPLGAIATQDDVDAGRAAFVIDGAQVADLGISLPAQAKIGDGEKSESVVVFQAERTPSGEIVCGIIGQHRFESVPREKLKDLSPIHTETKGK